MQPATRYFHQASLLAALTAILSLAFQLNAIAAAADARPHEPKPPPALYPLTNR